MIEDCFIELNQNCYLGKILFVMIKFEFRGSSSKQKFFLILFSLSLSHFFSSSLLVFFNWIYRFYTVYFDWMNMLESKIFRKRRRRGGQSGTSGEYSTPWMTSRDCNGLEGIWSSSWWSCWCWWWSCWWCWRWNWSNPSGGSAAARWTWLPARPTIETAVSVVVVY